MNKVVWLSKALRQLRRIPKPDNAAIRRAVGELAAMPDVRDVKALSNHKHDYRLRVGRYRVLFDWDQAIRIVAVQEVKKRDEHTY